MDIQHLVDRLEDLIDEGRHVWFSKYTLIDEEHALEIIDQMRISVPEQIEKANRVINQRDRLLAQANEESERIVMLAQEQSSELVERDSIVQTAKAKATNLVTQAQREADAIRREADTYVLEVLKQLEGQLIENLRVVRNGVAKILEEREASREQMQRVYELAAAEVSQVRSLVEATIEAEAPTPPQVPGKD